MLIGYVYYFIKWSTLIHLISIILYSLKSRTTKIYFFLLYDSFPIISTPNSFFLRQKNEKYTLLNFYQKKRRRFFGKDKKQIVLFFNWLDMNGFAIISNMGNNLRICEKITILLCFFNKYGIMHTSFPI